ncbi:hypothetical protein AAFF_G00407600 [Aldrovandia affinis]|uniref:Uncharacterized protein n=1 Tax=Aldrovandia affinis TaxID=143900 RepID=A0AAD7SBU1_9TELE|nr:hypothetical protein AAFF_G00407600 [Aldrovandia affinis]
MKDLPCGRLFIYFPDLCIYAARQGSKHSRCRPQKAGSAGRRVVAAAVGWGGCCSSRGGGERQLERDPGSHTAGPGTHLSDPGLREPSLTGWDTHRGDIRADARCEPGGVAASGHSQLTPLAPLDPKRPGAPTLSSLKFQR